MMSLDEVGRAGEARIFSVTDSHENDTDIRGKIVKNGHEVVQDEGSKLMEIISRNVKEMGL